MKRVRDLRGEDEAPPLIEAEPRRADDEDLRTDGGGATFLPTDETRPSTLFAGPLDNLSDAIRLAGVNDIHEQGITGEGVIAVIVDTGICGTNFRADRHLEGADLTDGDNPFMPFASHGGMPAGIMAGEEQTPGVEIGFLPDADLFPIKTTLASSELLIAQDIITDLADETGHPIIVNNSWGFVECGGICDHPVTPTIAKASAHPLVTQVVAAGNSGTTCGQACDGSATGISGPNSLDGVITAGASGRDGDPEAMHPYSSRGAPGAVACGSNKPDLVAPVFGTAPWGCASRDLGNGPGTSAAAPMVAGAAGLIADANAPIPTAAIRDGLKSSADQFIGEGFNGCSGAGNLDAAAALSMAEGRFARGLGDTFGVATVGATAGLLGLALRRRFR